MRELRTIGHSTHEAAAFVALLRGAGIAAVADVRRFATSRRNPQFAREALAATLEDAGIVYVHLPQLGGRRRARPGSPHGGWRVAGFRGYADHMRTAEFAEGRAALEALAAERLTAVMCAEAHWWRCHRRLIADVFAFAGWRVRHVMPDGREVDHAPAPFAVPGEDGLPSYPPGGQAALL
jgi:uncharacterized protein (DUF488 family)